MDDVERRGDGAAAGGVAVWMDDSVRPDRQARALHDAMRGGRVPGGALYATPFQALRWLALHEAWSPARRDAGVQGAYDDVWAALAAGLGDERWALVSLGCGGGQKEERFLRGHGRRPAVALVADISPGLALASHDRVAPWCPTHAGVIDLEIQPGPSPWCEALISADGGGVRRVVLLLGMLPNLGLAEARRALMAWTRPGDWVVVSANLATAAACAGGLPGVLPQYDNAETRAWLSGFLEWQGLAATAFGWEVGVGPVAVPWASGGVGATGAMARVTMDAVMRGPVEVGVPGHGAVRWGAGGRLRVFESLRMTPGAVEAFGRWAGLEGVHGATDAAGNEGVWLLRR